MRILLIEDNHALAVATAKYLEHQGYAVDIAPTLAQAQLSIPLLEWDAILLDLHLPDGDGLTVLPLIRRRTPDTTVIILTAKDQISDRIQGLDAGADDYVVKPFDPAELLARLRAVERRKTGQSCATIEFGNISIDFTKHSLRIDDCPVDLTAKEWALLRVLATRPDRIHAKDTLANTLYGFGEEVGSNTVEVYISHLRRKLGRNSIQTYRGLGYRFLGTTK